jgi:hypothetical protein
MQVCEPVLIKMQKQSREEEWSFYHWYRNSLTLVGMVVTMMMMKKKEEEEVVEEEEEETLI